MSSDTNAKIQLPWTGERYVPEVEGEIELEHIHRYAIARELAYGKDVLDIACGEGYGSELLATVARKVTGVDISEEAIAHASHKYTRPNISFTVGSCADIPLADASVDIAVSFETIEHHDQHLEMMTEIRRVLRPGGVLIISSPDKYEYSDVPGYKNEYHVKELYLSEFSDLLSSQFSYVRVFGQRVYFGSLVAPIDGCATRFVTYSRRDQSVRREHGVMRPVYYVALASNAELPEIQSGLYEGTSFLNLQIAGLAGQVTHLNQAVAERDGQIASLNQAVAERDGQIASLNQAVAERDGQIASLNQAVAERDGQIASLNQAVAERDGQIASLNQAVVERDGQIASLNQAVVEHDALLRAVRTSTSWRITLPLRGCKEAASAVLGRERRALLWNVVGAVKSELRRRGLIGLAVRVPHYIRHRHFFVELLASHSPSVEHAPVPATVPGTDGRPLRLHPELTGVDTPIDHSVSIIIPTLNAGREFAWLLRKLRGQKGLKSLQIVVVDSGSTDGTVKLARAAGCSLVEIKPEEFSHSFARNTGAASASGDYLLFMVQDAYPIGDYWAYGMLRYLLEHAAERVVGVSCAECSRSDSDITYDSLINTHYRFLGCLEHDRIGEHRGDDHVSLRSYGSLSDVACLISREVFDRYRYRGDYAEDLDLGIRLVKDGYRVAMLASVKVVHSHNRSAHYFFKRAFVDVIFLTDVFEDFPCAPAESTTGLIAGIVSTAAHLSQWLESFDDKDSSQVLYVELAGLVSRWQKELMHPKLDEECRLGDDKLDRYVDGLRDRHLGPDLRLDRIAQQELRQFVDMFLARLEHFNSFARGVYLEQDGFLRQQLRDAVRKAFAAAAGSSLGFLYLARNDNSNPERGLVMGIRAELQAGI